MRLRPAAIGAVILLLAFSLRAGAQENPDGTDAGLQAVISGPEDIPVGRTIVLNGSLSCIPEGTVRYEWYLGDGGGQPISRALEALFTPERPGTLTFRLVVRATVGKETRVSEATHAVTVFRRKVALLADRAVPPEKLALHTVTATEAGVYLKVLQPGDGATAIGLEEPFAALLRDEGDALVGADALVLWTDSPTALQAVLSAAQAKPDLLASIQNQSIVLLTDRAIALLARTARGPFSVLRPRQIFITRKEALNPLLEAPTLDAFRANVLQRDIDLVVVDERTAALRPWNALSQLVNSLLTHGVPAETVILLLVLPVIATILAFLKQCIGITTFGLYTPTVITVSLLALGVQVGLLFLLLVIVAGYATREVLRRWRLLYIPRVAIILTVVSVLLLLLMGAFSAFGVTFSRETVFILLILSTLSESFLTLKTEEGWYSAIRGSGETLAAALLCIALVRWSAFQSLLLAYPEVLLLTIVANVALGRWSGLRLVEYIRFREVFRHLQEE